MSNKPRPGRPKVSISMRIESDLHDFICEYESKTAVMELAIRQYMNKVKGLKVKAKARKRLTKTIV